MLEDIRVYFGDGVDDDNEPKKRKSKAKVKSFPNVKKDFIIDRDYFRKVGKYFNFDLQPNDTFKRVLELRNPQKLDNIFLETERYVCLFEIAPKILHVNVVEFVVSKDKNVPYILEHKIKKEFADLTFTLRIGQGKSENDGFRITTKNMDYQLSDDGKYQIWLLDLTNIDFVALFERTKINSITIW